MVTFKEAYDLISKSHPKVIPYQAIENSSMFGFYMMLRSQKGYERPGGSDVVCIDKNTGKEFNRNSTEIKDSKYVDLLLVMNDKDKELYLMQKKNYDSVKSSMEI